MNQFYGNSFNLDDPSTGVNHSLHFNPKATKHFSNTITVKQEVNEQNLQCNIYLFLSIVHGIKRLNKLFVQTCFNRDQFLHLFDTQQYSLLLYKVLQIVNQYFNDDNTKIQYEKHAINKSWHSSDQKPYQPQPQPLQTQNNSDKFQQMIKKIISTDLDPLKSLIHKVQDQNRTYQYSQTKVNNTPQVSFHQNEKIMKSSSLKDQLKDKIAKLTMQNTYLCKEKVIKTNSDSIQYTQNNIAINESMNEKQFEREIVQKQNKTNFGQQILFNNLVQQEDQLMSFQNNGKQQKTIQESMPIFVQNQKTDFAVQTSDQQIDGQQQIQPRGEELKYYQNQEDNTQNNLHTSCNDQSVKRQELTVNRVRYCQECKNKNKYSNVASSASPQKSDRREIYSIDYVQHKRKIGSTCTNRNFNILTNAQLG
ncbi:unnamed protein product (macronuclear) [Paramecium tetraurelia]|uniref:Uncharacterized protein n=1 Tax=Paramecium tetraurelia TaxID=5888 RepID=A0BFE1_PARTE|nr:uncharacterized protein GSPATT00028293001 [Paramecium tetraurelia]CAK57258.1 unnamed protein product [Paramecium tetraurelia]|eukprot:XP_001424656.1 hypothetical protein (macronuclear) [Paramecium tetraurelia strain d4-2]